jgi:hypothetical protein
LELGTARHPLNQFSNRISHFAVLGKGGFCRARNAGPGLVVARFVAGGECKSA